MAHAFNRPAVIVFMKQLPSLRMAEKEFSAVAKVTGIRRNK
jgi:hypothetical protein